MDDPINYHLKTTIAEAVRQTFQELPAVPGAASVYADRIVAAIVAGAIERGDEWVVTKQDQWFAAATVYGDTSVSGGPGCWHYNAYCNSALAGDEVAAQAMGVSLHDPDDVDYLHICTLDSHIAKLIALRELHWRWREGEALPVCPHRHEASRDGVSYCQACGHPSATAPPGQPSLGEAV